jgi:nucleoside-diphosphate-sugar epimerase
VTGASGFFGANIVKFLAQEKRKVICTTRNKTGPGILVSDYLKAEKDYIKWVKVDVTDNSALSKVFKKYNIKSVVHTAFITPGGIKSFEKSNSNEILKSNITGTINVLEHSKIYSVKKFVFISSSSVYGKKDVLSRRLKEDDVDLGKVKEFYSISNIVGEKLTERYCDLFSFLGTSLRFPVIYGPVERTTSSRKNMGPVYKMFKLVLEDCRKKIFVKGLDLMVDWIYVMDAARSVFNALEAGEGISPVYNVSCGEELRVDRILEVIREVSGYDFVFEELDDDFSADLVIKNRDLLSISKAQRELNFSPSYDIFRGLREYLYWWKSVVKRGIFIP